MFWTRSAYDIKLLPCMNLIELVHIKNIHFLFHYLLPNNEGKDKAAGPGPWNSAAIGPLLLVGVQEPLCPPIFLVSSY